MVVIIIPKLIGVFGLLSLPNDLLVTIIYSITFLYGLTYIFNYMFTSKNRYFDNVLLSIGGYASGTSLIGAPILSTVFARHVAIENLRTTLFVLWIIMVIIKMSTLVAFNIDLQFKYSMYLLPAAGHWLGLKMHNRLIEDGGKKYKQVMGVALVIICGYGLISS